MFSGLDLDCGPFLGVHTEDAVKKGLLNEEDVNTALANTLNVQVRLGMFDGEPSKHPFGNLGPKDVCTPAHQELALESARQGIVLLKNRGPSLPLSTRRYRTVAVIGPNSNVTNTMIGNYAGNLLFPFSSLTLPSFCKCYPKTKVHLSFSWDTNLGMGQYIVCSLRPKFRCIDILSKMGSKPSPVSFVGLIATI